MPGQLGMRIISKTACRSDFHMNKNFTKVKLENIKLRIIMLAFHLSFYFSLKNLMLLSLQPCFDKKKFIDNQMNISIFQITFETEVTKSHLHPGDVLFTVFIFTNLIMKTIVLPLYLS